MERLDRIKKISELVPTSITRELLYKGKLQHYQIYEVPLECLIFNKYNGRIYSRTKSLENTVNKKLDLENEDDVRTIKEFLWDSATARNEHTYESILAHGQLEYGIITKDGIIIDGNRRASIIMKINEQEGTKLKFKTIILEDALDEHEHDITDLETFYQIGIDGKVDYNPIEKYLKCEYLLNYHTLEEVSYLMSETQNRIKEWVKILNLMNEYLAYHGIAGEYTRLDKREGHFVDLIVYLNNYDLKIKRSVNVNWDYTEKDIDELKIVYFDFTFSGMPVAESRIIAKSAKSNSFFCHSEIWQEFLKNHKDQITAIKKELEEVIDKDTRIIIKADLLKVRLMDNFNLASLKLQTIKDFNMPLLLLKRAYNALIGIDVKKIDKNDSQANDLISFLNIRMKEITNG